MTNMLRVVQKCFVFSRTCVLFEHYQEERLIDEIEGIDEARQNARRENERKENVANDWFSKVEPRLEEVLLFIVLAC